MPMTKFRTAARGTEELTGGLLKDFGDALARELAMQPRYLNLPRKRVEAALADGRADLLCDLRPEWMEGGGWAWSETVFTNYMIIAGRADTPPLSMLEQVAGRRIGTVLGYRYPEVESLLGGASRFRRDDAGSDDVNTNKLLNARFDYMMSNSLYYNYQRKVHPRGAQLNPAVFTIRPFDTYCALPPNGRLDLAQVNRAILTLHKSGEMQKVYARYRPQG
ncbi:ABC transporter substrate-binding protein [Massilia sp. PAMC28688]|uniref:substrate-binding periplasmic protein n=1 Tax=Massilia sp. PAMC28688 TaxID=2861283 RepID=UPI001E559148|nr:transporter substrate-binding domain-containing protein [Massilia sp. PAMC28688]